MCKWISGILWIILISVSCGNKDCITTADNFPELLPIDWIQAPPQSILKLKGKIILIRWWTDGCEYCYRSSDALNEWYQKYHESGLEILGIYHPKPLERQPSDEEIRSYIFDKGFKFPIGLDLQWQNLNMVWLHCTKRSFTSVSFLLNRTGRIIYIHEGGEYHKIFQKGHEQCVTDYNKLDSILRVELDTSTIIEKSK